MKKIIRTLCVIMAVVMALSIPLSAISADTDSKPLYVKDVIFVYGDSLKDAKTNLPKGYTMLETDLNQGTAVVSAVNDVYLAYSTTTNPDEAITDIKMMNMNGGFVLSDYNEQIENVGINVRAVASELKVAVEAFVENYKRGTYGAKAAYKALGFFTVDEADGMSLADYLIYEKVPDSFYLKLVLHAHKDVLSTIISALTMGVQGEAGNTWLDRLERIENPAKVSEGVGYFDKALTLWDQFNDFNEIYDTIDHELFKNGSASLNKPAPDGEEAPGEDVTKNDKAPSVEYTGIEIFYEIAYAALDSRTFGNGKTLAEWFVYPDLVEEELFAVIEVLTPGEYAMLHLGGLLYMILSTSMDETVYKNYEKQVGELLADSATCSVWRGVNSELFYSSIGITDAAARSIAETKAEQELNNDGDSGADTLIRTAGLIAAAGAVVLGVGITVTAISAGSLGAMLTGSVVSTVGVVAAITGSLCIAIGIVIIAIALVVVIIYFFVWLGKLYDEYHPDYSDIPEYMYDITTDKAGNKQYVLYEAAKYHDGTFADVNGFDGKEWHAPYLSRDKAAGNPISAEFKIQIGNGEPEQGFCCATNFGESFAANLNEYAFNDDVKGIFLTYRQEKKQGDDYAKGKYLSDIKIFTDTIDERCINQLLNEKYVLYNVNLTPESDVFTYIGYRTSNSSADALTDIRFASGYSSSQYCVGNGSTTYARCGSVGDLTLYTTRISVFGTPILSNFLVLNSQSAPAGYEPVNLFSGGPAVSIAKGESKNLEDQSKPWYLYFLPSVTYTSGTEYLGGIAVIYDVPYSYSLDNGALSLYRALSKLKYEVLATMSGTYNSEGAILYTTTYNPYRAIYDITAMKNGGSLGTSFTETMQYDGVSYMLATRYTITHQDKITFDYASRVNDARLYVAGIYRGGEPMKVSDIMASTTQSPGENGFIPLAACLSDDGMAVNLSGGMQFDRGTQKAPRKYTMSAIYLYVRKEAYVEGMGITKIYVGSKEDVLGSTDMSCEDLDGFHLTNALTSRGAHSIITKNLNLADSDNTTFIGYTKNPDPEIREKITDLLLYYMPDTTDEPEIEILHNGIPYYLVSDINLFCEEDGTDSKCKRVYLYYAINPAAGSTIIDITIDNTPILDGWQTVRTQNGKALYADMNAYKDDMWFIHVKRTVEEPEYISEVVVGIGGSSSSAKAALIAAGCEYMLTKDLNDGCGVHSNYIYIGYKKTSDPNQAICDLRTTHNEKWDAFANNGALYFRVEGNLNSYTNLLADDIFLYYSKDPAAGAPLRSLETSSSVTNTTRGEYTVSTVVKQNGKASELNDGAWGDYIYLLQIRETVKSKPLASMIGGGSAIVLVSFTLFSAAAITFLCLWRRKQLLQRNAQDVSTTCDDE